MDKKKIMIVDDESAFTRVTKLMLEKTGAFEVLEENKASHALVAAREFKPDLILLDIVMPDMDGGDVAARIQSDPELKKVPVVFLTALVSGKEARGGPVMRAGYRFLGKLTSGADLIRCIEENVAK